MAILPALRKASDQLDDGPAVPFNELRERIGMSDPGQFNYHLDKFESHFVRETESGYELRRAGRRKVQAVIAGAGFEDPAFERRPVDHDCPVCVASAALTYWDEWLSTVCTACDGFDEGCSDQPAGFITAMSLDAAAVAHRTSEEMLHAATVGANHTLNSLIEGVCPTFSDPLAATLLVCDDQATEGICAAGGPAPSRRVDARSVRRSPWRRRGPWSPTTPRWSDFTTCVASHCNSM